MRLDLFVKLKCQSSTVILSVVVKYSTVHIGLYSTVEDDTVTGKTVIPR